MQSYVKPLVADAGSLAELTLSNIYKSTGSGDVIVVNGQDIPVPGGGVLGVS